MKKLGIFGGTFSPPHEGHFKSALAFYDECALDELLIMPTFISPHKEMEGDATPVERLEMLKLLFSPEKIGNRTILVSDFEQHQGGKSYTYLTLSHFAKENPNQKIYLLMGTDMLLTLDEWKNPQIICDLATIVCNRRNGEKDALEKKKTELEKMFHAEILLPDFEPFPMSSSELREKLSKSESLPSLLSLDVENYIVEKELYSLKKDVYEIKKALKERLSEKRRNHVLSVEKEVLRLGKLFDLSEEDRHILQKAALLHDITHEWTKEEQLSYLAKKNFPVTPEDESAPLILHEYSGAFVAFEEFHLEKAGAEAIACHTTGKENMILMDKLLCLADYIEETRTYENCKNLRRDFYEALPKNDPLKVLDEALFRYFEETIAHIEMKGAPVHPMTAKALNFLKERLVKREIL